MNRIAAALFCIMFLLLALPLVSAEDFCTQYHHLGCHDGDVYWFDDCGVPHAVDQYCLDSEYCDDGWCQSKCGNGVCEDTWEDCSNCWVDCGCDIHTQICQWGECRGYCGNGVCEGDEDCSSCWSDCGCPDNTQCDYGKCVTYCGNGICEFDENCNTCSWDCGCQHSQDCHPTHEKADGQGCVERCGNGKLDYGEDCSTCPADISCPTGQHCFNGKCVECIQDSHCESRQVFSGEFVCAPDFRSTLEKGTRTQGVCSYHDCTGEKVEITRPGKVCGDKFCQDGHCGCNEGYDACVATGQCEKINDLTEGGTCGCSFQCTSDYCATSNVCVKAINTPLSIVKDSIYVGEETKVTISADNALDSDMPAKLTLNLDSGASMSGVIGGDDCTGNQCTGTTNIPAKGRKAIEVTILGQSSGTKTLSATVTATIDGSEYARTETITFNIINPGDGVCSVGETTNNACSDCGCPPNTRFNEYKCLDSESCKNVLKWWVYLIIAGTILGGALIVLVTFLGTTRRVNFQNMLNINKAKEFAERKRVARELYRISSQINPRKPWPVSKVIKKLRNYNPEIVHEEYNEMLDRMRETEHLPKEETKVEKMIKKVEGEGPVRPELVKRAWVGALMSLLFPALGFLYVRAYFWFAIYFAIFVVLVSVKKEFLPILWIFAILHSYAYIKKKRYLKNYHIKEPASVKPKKEKKAIEEREKAGGERKITVWHVFSLILFAVMTAAAAVLFTGGRETLPAAIGLAIIVFIWWPLKWLIKWIFNARISIGARIVLTIVALVPLFFFATMSTSQFMPVVQHVDTKMVEMGELDGMIERVSHSIVADTMSPGLLASPEAHRDILSVFDEDISSVKISVKDFSASGNAVRADVFAVVGFADGRSVNRDMVWLLERDGEELRLITTKPTFQQMLGKSAIVGREGSEGGLVTTETKVVSREGMFKYDIVASEKI